jgi:hypothetical protein
VGDDSSDPNLQQLINDTNAAAQSGQPDIAKSGRAAASLGAHWLAAAREGSFSIKPDVGEAYLRGLNRVIANFEGMAPDIARIQTRTQLGETPHAAAFADWNMQVAATGPYAFVPAYNQTLQALTDLAQALQIALDNYRKADDHAAGTFRPTDR